MRLQNWLISQRVAKSGRVLLNDLSLRSLHAMKQQTTFTEGAWEKWRSISYFEPFVDQSLWSFGRL